MIQGGEVEVIGGSGAGAGGRWRWRWRNPWDRDGAHGPMCNPCMLSIQRIVACDRLAVGRVMVSLLLPGRGDFFSSAHQLCMLYDFYLSL